MSLSPGKRRRKRREDLVRDQRTKRRRIKIKIKRRRVLRRRRRRRRKGCRRQTKRMPMSKHDSPFDIRLLIRAVAATRRFSVTKDPDYSQDPQKILVNIGLDN